MLRLNLEFSQYYTRNSEYSDMQNRILKLRDNILEGFYTDFDVRARNVGFDLFLFPSRDSFFMYQYFIKRYPDKASKAKYIFFSRKLIEELKSGSNRRIINDYFISIFENAKNIAFFDLGWTGNTFTVFASHFSDKNFTAFFVGRHRSHLSRTTYSYLGTFRLLKVLGGTDLLETIFTAPNPSVINISLLDQDYLPVYAERNDELLNSFALLNETEIKPAKFKFLRRFRIRLLLFNVLVFPRQIELNLLGPIKHSKSGDDVLFFAVSLDGFSRKPFDSLPVIPFWTFLLIWRHPDYNVMRKLTESANIIISYVNRLKLVLKSGLGR